MPVKAVVFDMDGVLVDSEVYWQQARVEYAADLGKTWTADDHWLVMGVSTIEWARIFRDRLGLDLPLETIIDETIRRVVARYEQRLPVLPGAVEAVHLAAAHYRVALASGSPTTLIRRVAELTGLDQVFEVMVFGDDIANGKPAPDIYLETLRQLGVSAGEAVGVEDSPKGIQALKAAGMYAIAVPSPEYPLPDDIVALADRALPSLEAFSAALVESLAQ